MKYKNFVTIEGIEGAGKSTLIEGLKETFKSKDKYFFNKKEVIFTREPGNEKDPFLLKIRDLIMNHEIFPTTELFLFQANRFEHTKKLIEPNLKGNKIVICDRFTDSSLVYQGLKGIKEEYIMQTNKIATLDIEPNTTFLIDLDPKIGQNRISNSGDSRINNKFDNYDLSFHLKIREKYLALAKKDNKRYIIIDGQKSKNEIIKEIIYFLNKRI